MNTVTTYENNIVVEAEGLEIEAVYDATNDTYTVGDGYDTKVVATRQEAIAELESICDFHGIEVEFVEASQDGDEYYHLLNDEYYIRKDENEDGETVYYFHTPDLVEEYATLKEAIFEMRYKYIDDQKVEANDLQNQAEWVNGEWVSKNEEATEKDPETNTMTDEYIDSLDDKYYFGFRNSDDYKIY